MNPLRSLPFALALIAAASASAQAPKKALTQADWDKWRSITGASLSNDGRWAVYTVAPLVGDGELVIRSTQGNTEFRVPRGYVGRANNIPGGLRPQGGGGGEGEPTPTGAPPAQITQDSKFVLAMVQPNRAEVERLQAAARSARGGARTPARPERNSLAIVSLPDGQVTLIPGVRSFRLPRENGAWVAYVPAPDSSADSTARGGRPGGATTAPPRTYGNPLVLRNLATGQEERLADVLGYAFDDEASVLGYTVVSRDSTKDGAFLRRLPAGTTEVLMSGRGNYRSLVFDSAGKQVAFLSDRDEFGKDKARVALYYATTTKAGPAAAAVAASAFGAELRISENAAVSFSRNGNAVLFGVAPPVPDSIPADSLTGKAMFDLWHYKDPTLQPAQKLNAARDRNRSFQSIYFPATKKAVRLANDSIPALILSPDAKVGLAASGEHYRIAEMWGDGADDIYVIDPATGSAKLIKEASSGQAQLSPEGRYVAWFDHGKWFSYSVATGRTVDLSTPIKGVSFAQENWDTPSIPNSWGSAGWTKGDKSFLLYDRYDVWEVDPTGAKPAVMVTDSVGRKEQLVLRVVSLDRRRGGAGGVVGGGFGGFGGGGGARAPIDPAEPLLLSAVNDDTKASGFMRDRLGVQAAPERIVLADLAFGPVTKAADAEQYLVTKSTFVEFPDLWTGGSLTSLNRISDANPQQKEYNWGTVELVRWTSTDGVPLKGLLYKPENFDPTKKYPLISYFYESLSQNFHSYIPPNGRNVINPTHYASNGYLVFEPDIHYEVGYPGPSAMKSVVPGVQMLLQRGYVDPKALGLQGQSWGGYQIAYMITQTRMFAAAMAGAPVVNMTSAYGGIRWGSGLARAFQYEADQSRIGGSIWEAPLRFVENSPLFWLDKVTTPLFIMSNDMDDAVPWYQGIEMFVAMRRLGKEIYFISYNNDVHNPQSRANQKDVAMRMQQFFDNKLRGAPAPDWMVKGIPYLAKGRDQLAPAAPGVAGAPLQP